MGSKAVQISLDESLLKRIDADPEVRRRGRSAVIRDALERYLRATRRRSLDEAIRRAYGDAGDHALAEVEDLLESQAWPRE